MTIEIPNCLPMLISGKYEGIAQQGIKGKRALFMSDEDDSCFRFEVVNGHTAILPIRGIIMHRFCWWYGGTACEDIVSVIKKLVAMPQIRNIILDIDSPGGEVGGVEQVANAIYNNRDKKNFFAVSNTLCASAAYWIASSCHKLYSAEKSSEWGSIGVILVHFSYEKAIKAQGVEITHIETGEKKSLGSPYRDLSDEEKEEISKEIHEVYNNFRSSVVRGRDITEQEIIDMEARTFMADESKKRRLSDGHYTVSELASILAKKEDAMSEDEKDAMPEDEKKDAMPEDDDDEEKDALAEDEDDEDEEKDGKKYSKRSIQNAVRLGVQMEQKRVAQIRAATIPGMEKFMEKFVSDGKTTAEKAIMKQTSELIRMGGMNALSSVSPGISTGRQDSFASESLNETNVASYLKDSRKKTKKIGEILAGV